MTIPLPFRWPYFLVFWPVYLWVFTPEFRLVRHTGRKEVPAEDRGSLRVIKIGFSAAALSSMLLPFATPTMLPGSLIAWFILGILCLIFGSVLRRHCFRILGTFFTGAVTVQDDHRLIDTGAYRWVRHPSYSAAILMLLGIALAFGSWLAVVVSLVIALVTYSYRAHVEEKALLSSLGAPYAEFMASRKRFIPFIY